ncbi:unnamed protein product, partial [Rotaria sp. Silwood1]
ITYLSSLCEHGDLYLCGACAHLLVTLIKTTIRLLTLSLLSNSFINQCSLVSTDSKDSSRLCLNDNNTRVIHVSLNALRALLPFLLINTHTFTIIEIELLEDSIQHTTSSYVLAKVSLAQFIDDIDFRILTYLEQ